MDGGSIVTLKVGGNEKQKGSGRSQMLDNALGTWRSRFIYNLNMQFEQNVLFPFPLVAAKWIGDYFEIRRYAQNFVASIYLRGINIKTCSACKLNHGDIIVAPLYWRTKAFLRKWRCGAKLQFNSRIFFLFGPVSFYAPNFRCANKLTRYK